MNKICVILFFSILTYACGNGPTQTVQEQKSIESTDNINSVKETVPIISDCGYHVTEGHGEGWNLIFEDEFLGDYEDHWIAWESGAYNDELQHYQPSNVIIDKGYLYLKGKREKVKGKTQPRNKKQKKFDFTSGRLESKKLFGTKDIEGQKTMKFSARVRLVEGEGMWPAWWSYGKPWPTVGEIDILEARGNAPYEFSSCYHYGKKRGILDTKAALNVFEYEHTDKLTECFHVYEMEWSKDSINIFFDEKMVKSYDVETYPYVADFREKEHMLCLNLAIGGIFFDQVDESKIPDESFYVIDWVKVFQK